MERPSDDLEHVLLQLTVDLERFDCLVRDQRDLLENAVHIGSSDKDRLRRVSTQLTLGVDEVISRARSALQRLRVVSELHDRAGSSRQEDELTR